MKSLRTASVAQCKYVKMTKLGAHGTKADLGAPFDGGVTRSSQSVAGTKFFK